MQDNVQTHQQNIEANVKEVTADLLKDSGDSLDLDKSFIELGINSVSAVELVEAINQRLGIELGIEAIFDYKGIKELAKYIVKQYGKGRQSIKDSHNASAVDSRISIKKSKRDLGSKKEAVAPHREDGNNHRASLVKKRDSDIAIIGISGKFAGSQTVEEFWDHLQTGDTCIVEIKRKGWEESRYYDPDPVQKNKSVSKWGGLLKDIDKFDASFFNISPLEAERMDPQQRLFMEEAYKAFEDAGYSTEELSGRKVGIFVGGRNSDYKEKILFEAEINSQTFLGNEMSMLAARLSYFLNLKGPSLAVDTACSSSLVAIHLACESIRKGESELALAGGAFVMSSPEFIVMSSKMGMLSPDGECKTFDNSANGMALGEGVGTLVLKRLKTAVQDGDHIYGVIKGSAVNQAGKTNGITAPSMLSQKELIHEAYRNASINPETVSYIEAHGTGTKLGDPIEVKALAEAFRMFTDKTQFCAVGSHKPNFGHTTMSAGIAGVFKILMAMKYRKIPPTIGIKEVNEHIDFNGSPFFINTKLGEWKSSHGGPLRAGVSSFGSSGTNCHLIIEEPPIQKNTAKNKVRPYYLFPFSAKTKAALRQKLSDMAVWLEKEAKNHSVEDISYTLSIGRSPFPFRCMFIAKDKKELKQRIREVNEQETTEHYIINEENSSLKKMPVLQESIKYSERLIKKLQETGNSTREVYKDKLSELSDLYIKGYNLDWGNLFKKGKYHRISLPAYPFNGERYWLAATGKHHVFLNNGRFASYQADMPKPDLLMNRMKFKGGLQVKEMDELLCKLLWGQLQSLGLFVEKNPVIADLKMKSGLSDLYSRWLEESLAVLTRNHYLSCDGESCSVIDTRLMDMDALWKEWDRKKGSWLEDPDMKAQGALVEATVRALPEIITGKIPATDIMFPNSSMKLVEGIFKNNKVADYFNEAVADTVVAYIQERLKQDSSAGIRILEIGAGTGGTSVMVFQKLKPYQEHIREYCYTDISKTFLMHAEKEYGPQNPYLIYNVLNVEAPIAGQGISARGYDIVIAANVLHATRNIRQTLRNTKALLRNNGLILLNEISGNSLFLHLTFGLLEGWWLCEDTALRIPGCPGLSPETWQTVLESEGFRSVFFPAHEAHDLGQQIIIAESDGVVHQNQPLKPDVVPAQQSTRTGHPPISTKTPLLSITQDQHLIGQKTKTNLGGVDITDRMVEDHVKETIIEKLSESLKTDTAAIDADESFADYGVDSILGVNLIQVVNQALMIELETTCLFDYSSVNQLTKYILSQYKKAIITALEQNVKHMDVRDELVRDDKEKQPAHSYPERLPGRSVLSGTDGKKKEEGVGDSIQKDSIAIIGMSGRFPKSRTVNELWKHLLNGDDLIKEVTRWDMSKHYSAETNYCKHGGLLEDIDRFDPLFFNISGLEATYMDPQQRIFLEESWKALEDAGYAGTGAGGRLCGIYVGYGGGDYQHLLGDNPPAQAFWGNMGSVVPARIAYYLDLQGPAIAVDTACSSSLVAIHLACQGLWSGETELALAGGVFIQSTPEFYLSASRAGMLSPTGRCYTFDERADGFVPAEGAGVVVLKRLKEAIAAGDHIYGVITGSGINQDGATNGITAPSANSQERLERHVYDTFHIHPEHIQMVEAHGTGTKLGDPIEYQALTRAFRKYTDKKEYCAIGTIKTNIGHTQIAAGVAGVIKILLSLQHKQIPPSLHYQSGNSNIQFKESPFYVNTRLKDWDVEPNSMRCAVSSSFGASGTNAHIAIEEAPKTERRHSEKPGYLIVLSARTVEQLNDQVVQLVAFCEQKPQGDCGNMSYTLMLGRKHFNHRLASVVRTQDELIKFFKKWLEKGKTSQVYVSELRENEHREQPSLKRYGNQCIQNCQNTKQASDYLEQLSAIAELYIQGYALEYEKLFSNDRYSRISMPTYPFARERYWAPEVKGQRIGYSGQAIHPLLHQNTSNLLEQRYSSIFTGREFFLSHHIVKGQRVLPGVAYLEMARAAVYQAAGALEEGQTGIQLKNVVWAQPISVGEQPITVHIGLFPEDNGEIAYEIYTESEGNGGEPTIHSQGIAVLNKVTEVPRLDIRGLQAKCDTRSVYGNEFYEVFQAMGLEYGPGHRGIENIQIGEGHVLAKLRLPESVTDSENEYILHPSLMDSALQSSIVLMSDGDTSGKVFLKPILPFALQELQVFGRCTSSMWALIRYSEGSKSGDKVQKLDIDVCDDQGNVCVRMKGFSSRVLEGEIGSAVSPSTHGTLMLEPIWKEQAVAPEALAPEYIKHLMILCEPDDITHNSIESRIEGVHCLTLQSGQAGIEERFQTYAATTFQEIQNILRDKPKGRVLVQIVVSTQKEQEQRLFSGLSGLLKTARLENPKLIGQLIEIESWNDTEDLIERLKENSRSPIDNRIRYQAGKRHITVWNQVQVAKEQEGIPWKDHGIYLITGGAGSLGLIFAEEITQKAKEVTLILTGRSELNEGKQARLKELEVLGAKVQYKQVDITDKRAVTDLIQNIQKEFGKINGIIHGAGVIRDNFIIKKTRDEFLEVLAPKVAGLVNLDEASKEINLDFFILFSSIAGSLGNTGQADYSTANAFMDAYAGYRNSLTAENQRRGKTLSINWPLWKEGGMRIDEANEKIMVEKYGMIPMQTGTGIRALYHGMSSAKDQVMVMEGALKQLRTLYLEKQFADDVLNKPSAKEEKTVPAIAQDILREKATHYFKKLLSSVIKLPANRIEADAPMETYGIDSIMVAQLTNQLEKTFGSLSKTLFFEYQTIRELTGYFLESYRDNVTGLLGIEEKAEAPIPDSKEKDTVAETEPGKSAHTSRRRPRFASLRMEPGEEEAKGAKDIAIIGVSGRYPQARNIREFWKNLRDGKDCITEIPKDRWDHSLYFDEDKNKPGKTYSKWGGFIDDVDKFDPLFFNISPREAEIMDPQERLFLECVFETLEDAGYTRESIGLHRGFGLEGNIGVYVGVMYEEYQLYGAQEQVQGRPIALAGSPSSIANRVSYFCNFHGPSVALDTMCSSSLTAIHLACQSLERGGCEMAIAGGVNVSIHPNKYLFLGQGKFISSKGRCESFGQGGDGYVPGEGVGAVLLKPLSKAVADGDHIYGVIKATAINHGGKTNGYSVPNPNAQASVIGQAFKEAGITPGTISYIEAHGTGTSLGDPIEIAGLTKTFQEYTKDKQFCAIGSAKSNIGHCESAAGIAGVTKVLLQLKHRQLAPSLHSKALNPNIDFSNTPFVVQQELVEWKRPIVEYNGIAKEYPRIAGISSFGAGGSNAHVVIEEYLPKEERPSIAVTPQDPAIIVLSAKNEERLKEQTKQLLEAINEKNFSDRNLSDIAYTLQVGREAMEERVAVIVKSIKELEDKLKGFLENREGIDDLYRGQVKRNKETLAVFAADEDMAKTIDAWIAKRKYSKLLDLWVKGLIFDWNKLYGDNRPHRISLPTYPFARERYWVPDGLLKHKGSNGAGKGQVMHPLVHQNTSDLFGQRYSSTFTGQEFFLADHVVKSKKILPGVAYLEMARAAGELAAKERIRSIKNTLWVQPITVDGSTEEVQISLYPREEMIEYEISKGEGEEDKIVYAKGKLGYGGVEKTEVQRVDIEAVKKRCHIKKSGQEFYRQFEKRGFQYGPGFQVLREIYSNGTEAISFLELPMELQTTFSEYELHPSLMDGALQTTAGLISDLDAEGDIFYLPFAMSEVNIIRPLEEKCYAWARVKEGAGGGSGIWKYEIMLVNNDGDVLVRMKDFSVKGTVRKIPLLTESKTEELKVFYYRSEWEIKEIVEGDRGALGDILIFDTSEETRSVLKALKARNGREGGRIILVRPGEEYREIDKDTYEVRIDEKEDYRKLIIQLKGQDVMPLRIIHRWSGEGDWNSPEGIRDHLERGIYSVHNLSQALMEQKPGKDIRIIYLYISGNQRTRPYYASVSGFAKTVRLENPRFIYKTVEIKSSEKGKQGDGVEIAIKEIFADDSEEVEIRYEGVKRYVKRITEVRKESTVRKRDIPLKEKGVYILTGGAGGLGLIFAEYLARKVKAKLVLTGRSDLAEDKQKKLEGLKALGSEVMYVKADVSKREQVRELVRRAKERFGEINGILHAAGLTRDSLISKKTKEEMEAVFGPKIYGTVYLEEETNEEKLDIFVLFSSVAAVLGNLGQSDYAVGNAFLDAFAEKRAKEGRGRIVSINWPLWKDGGMGVVKEIALWLQKNFGMTELVTEQGLRAFEDAICAEESQMIVLSGEQAKINKRLGIKSYVTHGEPTRSTFGGKPRFESEVNMQEKIEKDLIRMLSELLKVKESDIDGEEELSDYGMDSIAMTKMLNQIEATYGRTIEPNSIIENNTTKSLARFLIEKGIAKPVGPEEGKNGKERASTAQAAVETEKLFTGTAQKIKMKKTRFSQEDRYTDLGQKRTEKIAVIGIACRFPKAMSVEAFWDNLREGKNCITEIPEDRWKISEYFSPDKKAENRSYSKWGGFLEEIYSFDAEYFGIKDEDALVMDPQQRIALELSDELLSRAGYSNENIDNSRTGVFFGGGMSAYAKNNMDKISNSGMKRMVANTIPNMIAARISDYYNLKGPSLTIDTACSSALVAIHQACNSIRNRESEMAIAGGIELITNEILHIGFSKGEVLSEDGVSYVFDERANGFVIGEGAGIVLLKRYEAAVKDGDQILGVILGSAINNDGHTMGLTVPNMDAQKEVIQQALENSGVSADNISYLEAHGTGTLLGDPIEIKAATQIYRQVTKDRQFCAVGSVKSNIGHLLRAAGVASFIKVVLALKHKEIPPTLNCKTPHPRFKFEESPFYPIIRSKEWIPRNDVRRAAISSFGFGGTNCHMILEEFGGEDEGYVPMKKARPLTQFKRKRYRLGLEIVDIKGAEENEGNRFFFMKLLRRLENGDIPVSRALEMIKTAEQVGGGR